MLAQQDKKRDDRAGRVNLLLLWALFSLVTFAILALSPFLIGLSG